MRRFGALLSDSLMCSMMYVLQRRHRLPKNARQQAESYLARHGGSPPATFFAVPALSKETCCASSEKREWDAPLASAFPENRRCRALLFPCARGWRAPTVLMLHALMSASDRGYREWARKFNARGWNAVFVHLPYHYSRTPRRHINGELAITADLIRTSEGLRSGVMELRQLMHWLRAQGSEDFALWACSYGGWIGALLAGLEPFRWIALLEPIADMADALWRSDAGRALRRHLRAGGIPPELVARFQPLVCPSQAAPPACQRVLFAAGLHDRIARPREIRAMHRRWPGSDFLTEPQGHFGFRLMRAAWQWLEKNELLHTGASCCAGAEPAAAN